MVLVAGTPDLALPRHPGHPRCDRAGDASRCSARNSGRSTRTCSPGHPPAPSPTRWNAGRSRSSSRAALFQITTGILNIARWYTPMGFFFTTAHYWTAWIVIGALLVHIAVQLPVIRAHLGRRAPAEPRTHRRAVPARDTRGRGHRRGGHHARNRRRDDHTVEPDLGTRRTATGPRATGPAGEQIRCRCGRARHRDRSSVPTDADRPGRQPTNVLEPTCGRCRSTP